MKNDEMVEHLISSAITTMSPSPRALMVTSFVYAGLKIGDYKNLRKQIIDVKNKTQESEVLDFCEKVLTLITAIEKMEPLFEAVKNSQIGFTVDSDTGEIKDITTREKAEQQKQKSKKSESEKTADAVLSAL